MSKEANEPIHPLVHESTSYDSESGIEQRLSIDNYASGLTKREHFAGLALQGFIARANGRIEEGNVAECSVRYADALLAELENNNGQ